MFIGNDNNDALKFAMHYAVYLYINGYCIVLNNKYTSYKYII